MIQTGTRQRPARSNPVFLTAVIPCAWVDCCSQPNTMYIAYRGEHLFSKLVLMATRSHPVNICSIRCSIVALNDLGVCLLEGWAGILAAYLLDRGLATLRDVGTFRDTGTHMVSE